MQEEMLCESDENSSRQSIFHRLLQDTKYSSF